MFEDVFNMFLYYFLLYLNTLLEKKEKKFICLSINYNPD
jgi:hypothetical protein